MSPVSVIALLSLVTLCEAMFSELPWIGQKNSRVLPGGDNNDVFDTIPNTPTSIKSNHLSPPSVTIPSNKSFTSFSTEYKVFTAKRRLKKRLRSANITKGFDVLTKNDVKELLDIDESIMTRILDSNARFHYLIVVFGSNTQVGILRFSNEIGQKLKVTRDLKGYLKLLVEFYSFCSSHSVLVSISTALLKSEIFTLAEFSMTFGVSYNEIFYFACIQNIPKVAKTLIAEQIISSKSMLKGVREVYLQGNEYLGKELIPLIGEHFGTDPSSVYHQILNELDGSAKTINK